MTNIDHNDRASALDKFAATGQQQESRAMIPQQAFSVGGDRVVGAQPVAVYRDDARVLARVTALAAAAGDEWYYRFPVRNKKENRTDYIEGGSIKLANDLARMYGNCDISTTVHDLGDSWLIYARFTDYETGFSMTRPFQQRKSGSRMGGDDDARRLDIALQIGVSKAIRNVILNALQTFADVAFNAAKDSLVEKIGKDLPGWRQRATDRLSEHVDMLRVERVIGRKAAEWRAPDVARAIALMKSVQDGMATLDETFPPLDDGVDGAAAAPATEAKALDQFAASKAEIETAQSTANLKAGIESDQAKSADTAATDSPGYKLAQEMVIACEKAKTAQDVMELKGVFSERIKKLDKDDRLDVNAIRDAYEAWKGDKIGEKELEQQVYDRLEMVRKRSLPRAAS